MRQWGFQWDLWNNFVLPCHVNVTFVMRKNSRRLESFRLRILLLLLAGYCYWHFCADFKQQQTFVQLVRDVFNLLNTTKVDWLTKILLKWKCSNRKNADSKRIASELDYSRVKFQPTRQVVVTLRSFRFNDTFHTLLRKRHKKWINHRQIQLWLGSLLPLLLGMKTCRFKLSFITKLTDFNLSSSPSFSSFSSSQHFLT